MRLPGIVLNRLSSTIATSPFLRNRSNELNKRAGLTPNQRHAKVIA